MGFDGVSTAFLIVVETTDDVDLLHIELFFKFWHAGTFFLELIFVSVHIAEIVVLWR